MDNKNNKNMKSLKLLKKCTSKVHEWSEKGSGFSRFDSVSILSCQSVLTIFCLLFLGVGNVWATETLNNVYMDWNFNGVQFYTINSNQSYGYASSDNRGDGVLYDLGVLTTKFEIRSIYWKVSTNWNPSCCNGWMKYQINGGEVQSMNYNSDCGSGDNQQIGGNFSPYHEVATSSGAPGVYYFVHWFEAYFCHESGGGSNKATLSNNSKNYKFQYTIPGFTTTSTSQTFVSALSSYKDETISFGQHYGTALTVVDNCEITGTDASLFSVQSISETGVTVRFSPGSSAGVKTATLTITDAHEKTCTITLTGKSKVTVTYNQGTNGGSGSEVTDDKVYGVDLTLKGSGFFTRTGYDQTAWNTNTAGSGGTEYSLNGTYTSESAITLYPTWDAHTYTVTLKPGLGGSGSDGSLTVDYDAAAINGDMSYSFSNSGYSLCGWYPSQGSDLKVLETNGTFAASSVEGYITNGKWSNASDCDLHAHWCANTYKITFDATTNGGSIINNGGTYEESSSRKIDATYGSIVSGTMPTARKDGYHFKGWYSAASDGLQIIDADGNWQANKSGYTDGEKQWKNADNVTLYAQYSISISGLTFTPSSVLPSEEVTVTTNFSGGNPEGTYSFCYKLTTGAGIEMEVQPEFAKEGLTATFEAPGTPGTYSVEARLYAEASHDCATAGSPVASYTAHGATFTVESTNVVTVMYKCGDVELRSSTTVQATASQRAVDVTAPEIAGLTFTGWTRGANVTRASGDNDNVNPISIYASAAGTLTANYSQSGYVYFKKTIEGWGDNVYLYEYNNTSYWGNGGDGNYGTGAQKDNGWTNRCTAGPIEMTLVDGTTDVYYCKPASVPGSSQSFVFTNSPSEEDFFGSTEGTSIKIVRVNNNFSPTYHMIVPEDGTTETKYDGRATYYTRYFFAPTLMNWGWNLRGNWDNLGDGCWTNSNYWYDFTAPKMGSLEFTAKRYCDHGHKTHYIQVYTDHTSGGGTGWGKLSEVIDGTESDIQVSLNNSETPSRNITFKTSFPGEYVFTLTYGPSGDSRGSLTGNIKLAITYPVVTGDFRLVYTDGSTYAHPGNVIKKRSNGLDTVSMYVAAGKSGNIQVQSCTGVAETSVTWSSCSDPTYAGAVNFASILSDGGAGTYNFIIQQNADASTATIIKVEKYTGQFYIRTDCVDDKWEYWKSKDKHMMTYSEYSTTLTKNPYSHYFIKDLHGDESEVNIKFTIANDYSEAITDTVTTGDASGDWKDNLGAESLTTMANVRFTYNQSTNKIWRAYTIGPSNDAYMVLRSNGTDVFVDNAGTKGAADPDIKFGDLGNWVYQVDVWANVNAYVKLTAYFNGITQYLKGNSTEGYTSSTAELLLGGNSDAAQHMRITYDFKTERMITSWLPPVAAIDGDLKINADIMLIRSHQEEADAITFVDGEDMLEDVKTVYGVMQFDEDIINNSAISRYARDLYWISFPFDVKLSDVFGFGTYGVHWIIEYYDGKGRAKNGFWADSPSNWKFVTPAMREHFVLNANEGYILALDLDEMWYNSATKGDHADIWDNVTTVYLYFPSSAPVGTIKTTDKTVNFTDQNEYKCEINRGTTEGDRRIKDSYWHCIGVPSYAGAEYSLSTSYTSGTPIVADADWTAIDLPFLYEWNSTSNTLVPQTTSTFDFKAMHSYLVQYSQNSMSWTNVSATPDPSPIVARVMETPDKTFNLALLRDSVEQDHTYVRLTDEDAITNRFEFNYDLSKEYNAGRGNIWTVTADTVEVAGNSMPKPVQTTVVPVGVKVVANGEYTLSMPDGTNGEDVYLIDNAYGTRTNLGLMPYTVTLTAGTYDSRFALEFAPIQETPTNIEQMSTVNYQMSTINYQLSII